MKPKKKEKKDIFNKIENLVKYECFWHILILSIDHYWNNGIILSLEQRKGRYAFLSSANWSVFNCSGVRMDFVDFDA